MTIKAQGAEQNELVGRWNAEEESPFLSPFYRLEFVGCGRSICGRLVKGKEWNAETQQVVEECGEVTVFLSRKTPTLFVGKWKGPPAHGEIKAQPTVDYEISVELTGEKQIRFTADQYATPPQRSIGHVVDMTFEGPSKCKGHLPSQ